MNGLNEHLLKNLRRKQCAIINTLNKKLRELHFRNFKNIKNDPNYRKLQSVNNTMDELNSLLLQKCVKYEETITDMYNTMLKHGIHYK